MKFESPGARDVGTEKQTTSLLYATMTTLILHTVNTTYNTVLHVHLAKEPI